MKTYMIVTSLVVLSVIPILAVEAQIPQKLSYQGVLSDTSGTPKPDGSYALTFRLYEISTGGSALWTETKTLQIKRGLFYTILSDQTPFGSSVKFDKPYWLGIQVQGEPQELSPRIPLTSVGYSFNSLRIENLRIVRGTISGGGAILQGAGFTSTRDTSGIYTITYDTPFAFNPTLTLATHNLTSTAPVHIAIIRTSSATTLTVWIREPGSSAVFSENWEFIAIGQ